jgi:uncharacterized protein (DUF4415 family)
LGYSFIRPKLSGRQTPFQLMADVLAWFKKKDIPYQTLINGALRNYMEHHKGD